MKDLKTGFSDRITAQQEAKKALLAKFKPKAAAPDPEFELLAEKSAAEKEALRQKHELAKAELRREKAEKEAKKAAEKAEKEAKLAEEKAKKEVEKAEKEECCSGNDGFDDEGSPPPATS